MLRHRLRTGLFVRFQLVSVWLVAVTLWLLTPLFKFAAIAIFFAGITYRPVWAIGTLAGGVGIGVVVLWASVRMLQEARREYREAKQAGATNSH